MANIDKSIRVRKLKTGSDTLVLPSQQKGNEGNVGKFYDNYLKEKGFEINSGRGIDLPGLHIENKTRKRSSKAPHTVGTITYDNIINKSYRNSTIFDKLQQQNRMEYDDNFNSVVEESVYDFRRTEIQDKIEQSYEHGRALLRQQGAPAKGTVVGGPYGVFEHKSGNSYAYRIPDSGMRELKNMAKNRFDELFSW